VKRISVKSRTENPRKTKKEGKGLKAKYKEKMRNLDKALIQSIAIAFLCENSTITQN